MNADVRAFLETAHHALAEEVAAFCGTAIAPLPHCDDDASARVQAREIVARLGGAGFVRYALPERFGGVAPETDLRALCLIREALAYHSPLADSTFALQCLGGMPLVLSGNADAARRFLPEIAAGRVMAAFAMTEPEAGSDVKAMRTRARRQGDEYRLDGGKHLITNAGIADLYVVFAALAEGEPDERGVLLACFAVPADTPGLVFEGAQILSEPHPLGVVRFDACRVPASLRLGAEGDGLRIGLATLDRLRPTVAAAACGMARRALDEAVAHARARHQFGQPLADFQLVQDKLARMAIDLTAARLLVFRAAFDHDAGAARITGAAAMAKAFATEAAQRIIDQALQIVGGRGALAEHPVERLYRAIRPLRIYEGTTEIQHLIIARELLKAADERN